MLVVNDTLDCHLARRLCDMLEVDMKKVPAFKDAIDDADYKAHIRGVAESIAEFAQAHVLFKDEDALDPLYELPLDHLRQLRSECYASTSSEDISEFIADKFAQFGFKFG